MEYSYTELNEEMLTSEWVKQFYCYWSKKRGERMHPSFSDVDLDEIAELTPFLIVVEVAYPPLQINYLFLGEQIIRYYRRDFTGQLLTDVFEGAMLRHYEIPYRITMTRPLPLFGREDWPGSKASYEWGMFACSEDGCTITHVLVIEDYSALNLEELPRFVYKK